MASTVFWLPSPDGNNGIAAEINNRGQIVGTSETPNPDPTCSLFFLQIQAVVWQGGHVQELPPFPGDPDGAANAINDNGQAVGGTGCATGNLHAVLWQNGMVTDLGNLGGAGANVAFDINNRVQIVGQSNLPSNTIHHAFLWTEDEGMQDLGTLHGLPTSLANGINNRGQIVGFSQDANGDTLSSVAFIWQNGVMMDLNNLIPPNFPLFLLEVLGINDRGQIAGYGLLSNGEIRAYLLTPCDEENADVEACDHSLLEATTETPVRSAPITTSAAKLSATEMIMRHRFSNRYRRFGALPLK
jgi:probable HAF family extracellular repeat protein